MSRLGVGVGLTLALLGCLAFFVDARGAPPGYTEDTLSVALNAACLLTTGRDEYGTAWPVVGFRSLDDYKGTLNLYALALAFKLLGAELFHARLLSMSLTLLASVGLVAALRAALEPPGTSSPALDGAFLALLLLSPWLLLPERVMVEDGVIYAAMAAAVVSTMGLLRAPVSIGRGALNGLAVGLLAYCYSPGKVLFVVHPLVLLLVLALRPPRGLAKLIRLRGLLASLAATALLGLPHLVDLLGPQIGLSRFRTVEGGLRVFSTLRSLAAHMSPGFLFLSGDPDPHHHFGHWGMLNLFFLPLLIAGMGVALSRFGRDPLATYALLMLPACLLPGVIALRNDPHALRSLLAVFPIAILSYYGMRAIQAASRPSLLGGLALAVWTAVCGLQAVSGLRHFTGPYSERNLWGYTRPKPAWNLDTARPAYSDHTVETLGERTFRVLARNDIGYCAGAPR